jgi:dual specificity MAP kinase phosphatase
MRNLNTMTERVVDLVYFLRKIIEGRDKSGVKRRVLVHCQDGYTESSIVVLAYIMSSLSISLPEAFLHLQLTAKRSFFLYPSDKPLLRKIDARLAADRRAKAIKLVSSTPSSAGSSPISSRWKAWGFGGKGELGGSTASAEAKRAASTIEVAREMLVEEDLGGSVAANEAKIWFDDRRFDGFPSRILPFLYLGNLCVIYDLIGRGLSGSLLTASVNTQGTQPCSEPSASPTLSR